MWLATATSAIWSPLTSPIAMESMPVPAGTRAPAEPADKHRRDSIVSTFNIERRDRARPAAGEIAGDSATSSSRIREAFP